MAHVAGYFIIIAYLFQLSGGNLILTQEEGEEEEGEEEEGEEAVGEEEEGDISNSNNNK